MCSLNSLYMLIMVFKSLIILTCLVVNSQAIINNCRSRVAIHFRLKSIIIYLPLMRTLHISIKPHCLMILLNKLKFSKICLPKSTLTINKVCINNTWLRAANHQLNKSHQEALIPIILILIKIRINRSNSKTH